MQWFGAGGKARSRVRTWQGRRLRGWSGAQVRTMALIMAVNIVEGIDNQLFAVSLPAMAQDWGFPAQRFAGALSVGMIGAAAATPAGGWLGDRLGRKPTVLIGLALFALGTAATALPATLDAMVVVRLVTGLGLGLCLPPVLALATESVAPQQRGTAVALTMFSLPVGLALAGLIGPAVLPLLGWRWTFVACGLGAGVLALVVLAALREPGSRAGGRGRLGAKGPALPMVRREDRGLLAALVAMIVLVYVVMSVGMSWLPAFLKALGYSLEVAAGTTSAWSLAGMAGTLGSGWLADRLGPRRAVWWILLGLAASLAAAASGLALGSGRGLAQPLLLLAAGALVGLFVNAAITAIYGLAADAFPGSARARVIGIVGFTGKLGAIAAAAAGPLLFLVPGIAPLFAMLCGVAILAWACAQGVCRAGPAGPDAEGAATG